MWPSTTKAFSPLSLKPLPERVACILVFSGRCFAPSSIASAASNEPAEIFGRYSDFCASLPPRDSAEAATTPVDEERRRHQRAADLLHHDAGLDCSLTRCRRISPAPAGRKIPSRQTPSRGRGKIPVASLAVAQLPQMRHRRLVADKAARAVAQHGLFFGEDECHEKDVSGLRASRDLMIVIPGRVRRREPGIVEDSGFAALASPRNDGEGSSPRQIEDALGDNAEHHLADVPPSIELALVRSHARGRAPPRERSLSHSSASMPPADIRISWRRLLSSVP